MLPLSAPSAHPAPSPEDGGGLGRGQRAQRASVIPAKAGISPPFLPLRGRCPKGREGSARSAHPAPSPEDGGGLGRGLTRRKARFLSPPLGEMPEGQRGQRAKRASGPLPRRRGRAGERAYAPQGAVPFSPSGGDARRAERAAREARIRHSRAGAVPFSPSGGDARRAERAAREARIRHSCEGAPPFLPLRGRCPKGREGSARSAHLAPSPEDGGGLGRGLNGGETPPCDKTSTAAPRRPHPEEQQ